MPELSSEPSASPLAGTEKLVGDQGGTNTVTITPAQIAAYVEAQDAVNLAAAIATATTEAANSASAAAASAAAAAMAAGPATNNISAQSAELKGYSQTADTQLAFVADAQDNPVALWDTQFEFVDGPMAPAYFKAAPSQTVFPLASADQVPQLTGGNWNGFISYGQSHANGLDNTGANNTFVSTSQPYANLTFVGGPRAVSNPAPGGTGAVQPTGSSFTASISGTVMTVSAITAGNAILVGQAISGAGVTGGTVVTSWGTGTGGIGTYNVNNSQTVASEAMTGLMPGSPANGTASTIPLVETNYIPTPDSWSYPSETPCSGMANYATERAFVENQVAPGNFVIFTSTAAKGGQTIASLQKGSAWYPMLTDHVTKAKALATAAGKTFNVQAIAWLQGPNDIDVGTSYASYKAALIALQSNIQTDIQAITGQSTPVHLILGVPQGGDVTSPSPDQVLPAMLDACNGSTRIHMFGPYFHLPNTNVPQGFHMSVAGYDLLGRYLGRAYKQLVIEQRRPDWLNPAAVYVKGLTVYVRFNVPKRPLVLDTELVGKVQNFGFRVTDGTGDLTLSNIKVMPNGDTVSMTINRALASTPQVRLGLDYSLPTVGANGGTSASYRQATGLIGIGVTVHNLRDSTKDWTIDVTGAGFIDGSTTAPRFLSYWAAPFSAGRAADTLQLVTLDPNA